MDSEQVKDGVRLTASASEQAGVGSTGVGSEHASGTLDSFWRAVIFALVGMLVGCIVGYIAFGKPLAAGVLFFALGVLGSQVLQRHRKG